MTAPQVLAADPAVHLLPGNATALERALSASDHRMLSVPHNVIRDAWNPDVCPPHLLPYLAAAWSVDEWDPVWTVAQQRQAIRDSLYIHQHKGTIGALRRAIGALGMTVTVDEWFRYGGAPYTFRLRTALPARVGWTRAQSMTLYRTAIHAKNVRSLLDSIVITQPTAETTRVVIGCGVGGSITTRLVIAPLSLIVPPAARPHVGAAVMCQQFATILPRQ